jgi:redox-sensitive bicupin YhaK (pirin superfamily)
MLLQNSAHIVGPVKGHPMTIGAHFSAINFDQRQFSGAMNPLLMVDHFRMRAPTFGPHPHAGISAVTYVFEDSASPHQNRDSMGNFGPIRPGSLHWMVAGKGVVHDEWPADEEGETHGLQFFVDLPAEKKSLAPYAVNVESEDVPIYEDGRVRVRVVAGQLGSLESPIALPQRFSLLDCFMGEDTVLDLTGKLNPSTWAYAVREDVTFNLNDVSVRLPAGSSLALGLLDKSSAISASSQKDSHFVLMSGEPVGKRLI